VEGSTAVFCQLALEQPGPAVEILARRLREHSTYCAMVMARIKPSWRYNLSSPSTEGVGNISRSVATVVTF
jgi:hypothetical protein